MSKIEKVISVNIFVCLILLIPCLSFAQICGIEPVQGENYLIKTNWNQKTPYNDKTPYENPDIKSWNRPVGCAATAISQLLYYWQYPCNTHFDSSDSYISWMPEFPSPLKYIHIDKDSIAYGFPTFLILNDELGNINYDDNLDEISYLNFAVGIKLETDYGVEGSGAFMTDIENVLQNDFYFGSAEYISGPDVWNLKREKVIENINNGWPVLLGIQKSLYNKSGRHIVLVDGYKEGSFHVNIGWSGRSLENAWYNIPKIDKYDHVFSIVYNISPYKGWHQYGADERNSFGTIYDAPNKRKNKWQVTCPTDYSFGGLVIGSGNKIYASCSPKGTSQHPYVYVINKYGDQKKIEINANEKIEFISQAGNEDVFISTENGEVYRINTRTDTAKKIFPEPNGDDIYSLKVDKEGYLYANTFYNLYCLDVSGESAVIKWTFPAPGNTTFQGSRSIPAIDSARNRVYISYYDSNTKTPYFASLNKLDGTPLAQRVFDPITIPTIRVPSIATDGTIYLGIHRTLYALNPEDIEGEPKWTKPLILTQTPAIGQDGTLYVPYWEETNGVWYSKLGALKPEDGSIKWEIPFLLNSSTEDIFQPYVAGNGIVCFTVERDGSPKTYTVYAYKDIGNSYQYLWEYDAGTSAGDFAFGPGETVYFWGKTGLANTIYAVSEGELGDPSGIAMDYTDNQPPDMPSNPTPSHSDTGIGTEITLQWKCSDPDGHSLKYNVYLGSVEENKEAGFGSIATQLTSNSFKVNGLKNGAKYFWKVTATDGQSISKSPIWNFSTKAPIICTDIDSDGYYAEQGCGLKADCNDKNSNINPGVTEVCDKIDNDCDGEVDEGMDSFCDDGLYCNGVETCDGVNGCQAGTSPNCSDGVGCTDDSCDEANNRCVNTANNTNCDDGSWCNGQETCVLMNDCQSGTVPDCNDGIDCTEDSCDEANDICVNTVNCDDGVTCTEDICNPNTGCNYPLIANCSYTATFEGDDVQTFDLTQDGVQIDFAQVDNAGVTTVIDNGAASPTLPANFNLAGNYYDITTTASFTGTIEVCITYDDTGLTQAEEEGLSLLHFNENTNSWEDKTLLPLDTVNNYICCEVDVLSPFAAASPPPDPDVDGDGFPQSTDCDDNNPNVNPGAAEVCGDGVDNDCSGGDSSCGGAQASGDDTQSESGGGGGGCSITSTVQSIPIVSAVANILILLFPLIILGIRRR